jgi:hypothetical protein
VKGGVILESETAGIRAACDRPAISRPRDRSNILSRKLSLPGRVLECTAECKTNYGRAANDDFRTQQLYSNRFIGRTATA